MDANINLDAMTTDELMNFWSAHNRGFGYAALIGRGRGHKRAVADLANYASNKAAAMTCRLRGDINTALMYEDICDRIYAKLPAIARW